MAAPSFAVLYDFETPMESALNGILVAAFAAQVPALTVQVLSTQAASIEDAPRVEITFATGAALPQWTTIGQGDPKQVPCAFEGTFTVRVVTTRPSMPSSLHGTIRGLCRYALSAGAKAFTGVNLPYLQILNMLPSSTSPQIYDAKEQDVTELSYVVTFAIKNDAWPASP